MKASAGDFPKKAIRIITLEVGGGVDTLARLIAQGISGPLGQPVHVENHEVDVGIEMMSNAPADGYTLCMYGPGFWTRPLMKKTPYDPLNDFSPIVLATTSPLIVIAHPSLEVTSLGGLIALAKARPGEITYVSGFNGAVSQLAGALLTHMAGIDMKRVPYRAGVAAFQDLMDGKVQVMIPSAVSGMPYVKKSGLRALAVASAEPSVLAPGLPTAAAAGLPGYEMAQKIGVFAPAGTPASVVKRLNEAVVTYLKNKETTDQLLKLGLESVGSTPEELTGWIKSEMTRLGKVIRDANISAN